MKSSEYCRAYIQLDVTTALVAVNNVLLLHVYSED